MDGDSGCDFPVFRAVDRSSADDRGHCLADRATDGRNRSTVRQSGTCSAADDTTSPLRNQSAAAAAVCAVTGCGSSDVPHNFRTEESI